ncbi:MAG: LPS-assembly protein LptD [Bacteriovoracia bacterium]
MARATWAWFVFFVGCLTLGGAFANAVVDRGPLHLSGDKTKWDRKRDRYELWGFATVNKPGESITADYVVVDLTNRTLNAYGNCIYTASQTIILAEEIHFNLDTSAGTIVGGKVTNGQFLLVGERINKLGQGRYQTHKAEYTTCRDCPGSWSFMGDDVDIEFEGYMHMSNVSAKVKDTPMLWFPYLIIPVKTKRQSGLLFPKLRFSKSYFRYVQPFFWATSRSTDMTIGLGGYSDRGFRAEWEGRYALSPTSSGVARVFYLRDRETADDFNAQQLGHANNRWAIDFTQKQDLPLDVRLKFRFLDISDRNYLLEFSDDVPGRGESVLASDLILSHATPTVSTNVAFRRFRSLLNFEQNPTTFDDRTVQLYPKVDVSTNNRFLFGTPIAAGLSVGLYNFMRSGDANYGSFDGAYDFDPDRPTQTGIPTAIPGLDPLRRAVRFSVFPTVYTTLRPGDVFSLVPSVQYRGYFYSFNGAEEPLGRGYLLFQTELSTQFERIYDMDDPDIPKLKHLVRPFVRYSRIGARWEDESHPFIQQIARRDGYKFDNNDIVPYGGNVSLVNYFTPLGNSLTYGFTTQWIRRKGALNATDPSYQRIVEFRAGQTLDLVELDKPDENKRIPFTRLETGLGLNFDRWTSSTQYNFYPFLSRLFPVTGGPSLQSPHEFSTHFSYSLIQEMHQEILLFQRSLWAAYSFQRISGNTSNLRAGITYSLSDYVMPSLSGSYDFTQHYFNSATLEVKFQSPSRCWAFSIKADFRIDRIGSEWEFPPDLSLNLVGTGFDGVSGVTNRVIR